MEIKNIFTNKVIFKSSHKTIKKTIVEAVKESANLSGANLYGANLCDTWFQNTKITYKNGTYLVNFTKAKE